MKSRRETSMSRRSLLAMIAGSAACATTEVTGKPTAAARPAAANTAGDPNIGQAVMPDERFELPEPGPMILPVPAIVIGVAGDDEVQDELSVVWTYVVNGTPPQIGIAIADQSQMFKLPYVVLDLVKKHREFTLNVPDRSWVEKFDIIDMEAGKKADKFERTGLTRMKSKLVNAPGVAEAAVVVECKVVQEHRLPPIRTVFLADVVRTSVHPGVADPKGRLIATSREFFGMTSGSGEFYTFGEKIGHIGMTVDRDDVRY